MKSQQIVVGFVLILLILGTTSLLVSLMLDGSTGANGIPGDTGPYGPPFEGILDVKMGGTNVALPSLNPKRFIISNTTTFQEGTSSEEPAFDTTMIRQKLINFKNPSAQTSVQFQQSGIVYLQDTLSNSSYWVLNRGDEQINGLVTFNNLVQMNGLALAGGVGVQQSTKVNGGRVVTEGKQLQLRNTKLTGEAYLELKAKNRTSFVKQDSTGLLNFKSQSHLFVTENRPALLVQATLELLKTEKQILFGTNVTLSVELANKNVIYQLGNGIVSSNVCLTQGNQTMTGIKTFSNLVPIQNVQLTTNQFVLGNSTEKVTLNSSPKATDFTVTIPANISTSSFVLTEGNQTVNGPKTFSTPLTNPSSIIVSTTSNQIKMGTGTTVTLNSVPPSTSLVQTLPDVGVNSDFLMTEGTQTITGNPTFTNAKINGNLTTTNLIANGVLSSLDGKIALGLPDVTTIQLGSGFSPGSVYSFDTTIPLGATFFMSYTSSPGLAQNIGNQKQFANDCVVNSSLSVTTATIGGVINSANPRTYTMSMNSQPLTTALVTDVIWSSGFGTNWLLKTFPLTKFFVDLPGYYLVEYQLQVVSPTPVPLNAVYAWIEKDGGPSRMGIQNSFLAFGTLTLSGASVVCITNIGTEGFGIQCSQDLAQPRFLDSSLGYFKVTYLSPL